MPEVVGTLIPTQLPSLSDAADILEAFRLYHYGAPSGTNIGEYDPTNANTSNLVPNSIAAYINTLNTKVAALEATPGIQPNQLTGKGALITATANATVATLPVGSDGTILVANSAVANGLQWQAPGVTADNSLVFTNKSISLLTNTITGTVAQFNTALTDGDFATLAGTETLTNKTLTSPTINSGTVTGLYVSDSGITFEGTTADDFETVLSGGNATADRTVTLPDATGTVVTTGNLSAITSTGTLASLNVTGNAVYHVDIEQLTAGTSAPLLWDGRFIVANSSSPILISLPGTSLAAFPKGSQFTVFQKGTGQVQFTSDTPATVLILASPGKKLRAQYSSCTVIKLTDPADSIQEWSLIGDLVE